jgi:hypothetical protein
MAIDLYLGSLLFEARPGEVFVDLLSSSSQIEDIIASRTTTASFHILSK